MGKYCNNASSPHMPEKYSHNPLVNKLFIKRIKVTTSCNTTGQTEI